MIVTALPLPSPHLVPHKSWQTVGNTSARDKTPFTSFSRQLLTVGDEEEIIKLCLVLVEK